jgi:hypothetical protein
MSLKQNRQSFLGTPVRTGRPKPNRNCVMAPLSERETSDVRPQKVAKAKKLIEHAAYPSEKVVKSLADQIARFF